MQTTYFILNGPTSLRIQCNILMIRAQFIISVSPINYMKLSLTFTWVVQYYLGLRILTLMALSRHLRIYHVSYPVSLNKDQKSSWVRCRSSRFTLAVGGSRPLVSVGSPWLALVILPAKVFRASIQSEASVARLGWTSPVPPVPS